MFLGDSFRIPLNGMLACMLLIGMAPALLASNDVRAQGTSPGMNTRPGMGGPQQGKTADGVGTVTAVNPANRKVTLDHGPIPDINWPAMKMEFATEPSIDLSKVKVGDKVRFTLSGSGNSYMVQSMSPTQ
jgi:Cu(I)/Ag(I) efflux system periplasmic protein CusF